MGNQQSQSKSKEEQLLSKWTEQEVAMLGENKEPARYFSPELFSSLTQHSSRSEFLETAYQTIQQKDVAGAYNVFRRAVEKESCSLKQFVRWTVTSAVPLWFGHDEIQPADERGWSRLVDCLLDASQEARQDDWLSEARTDNLKDWQAAYGRSPSEIGPDEFSDWLEHTPCFLRLLCVASEHAFSLGAHRPDLHSRRLNHLSSPKLGSPFSELLSPLDYFLLSQSLPAHALSNDTHPEVTHRLLFSSQQHGVSWQVFVNKIVQQGSTLLLIRAKDGTVFGGYADAPWEYQNTDWYGNAHNFLFRLGPDASRVWLAQSTNAHYQYLCWGKKQLANGLGMGGQLDYCGLWIDADFTHGHSRAGPRCSTFNSPQLTFKDTFVIDQVEVWLMRPVEKEQKEDGKGVLNSNEDMEFMEMAGKKMYSKDLAPPPEKEKQPS